MHVQRCSKGRAIGKLLAIAAACAFIYHGVPYGASKVLCGCSLRLTNISVLAGKIIAVNEAELCLTPACVHAASELLYNLSPKYKELDPCDNFEELVCGGWRDKHDLRPDQGDAFTGTIMSEQSQLLLRHILEAPYPKNSQVWFLWKA